MLVLRFLTIIQISGIYTESLSNVGFLVWYAPSYMQRLLPLEDCLAISAPANATDPRDHFFATLGLTPLAEKANSLIDYSTTVAQVFSSAIILNIERNGNSLLFKQKEFLQKYPRLPNWMPNWCCPAIRPRQTLESDLYHASKDCKADFTISDDLQQLVLKGSEVSHVKAVESAGSRDFDFNDFSKGRFFNNATLRQYRTRKKVFSAPWQAIITDPKSAKGSYIACNRFSKGDDYMKIRNCCQRKRRNRVESSINCPFQFFESRKLLTLSHSHIALGVTEVEKWDLICLFADGNVSFIIRQQSGTRLYKYICEA